MLKRSYTATLCGLLLSFFLVACDNVNQNQANLVNSTMDVTDKSQSINFKPLGQPLKTSSLTASEAYKQELDDVFIEDTGEVVKLLKDDNDGSRHQRFIVKIPNGKTVLIAHNIDLAPRIDEIKVGETINFRGEYVYNTKGGIVHWTHHDPAGRIAGGWIHYQGKEYQ